MAFANSGLPVLLKEVDPVALERGMARIRKNDEKFGKAWAHHSRGKGSAPRFDSAEVELRGFNDSDLIIEAVFESLELKKQIFAELEKIAKPECVLATNTSVLDIDTIAQSTSRPEMAVGLHFFNPANVMRLLEIVRGKHTSKPVLATALSLAKSLHKVGVVVGNCFGFVDNRMLLPYIREAIFLVKEGTTPEHVDRVLYDWGMAMGIFAVSDVIGIDVLTHIFEQDETVDEHCEFQAFWSNSTGRGGWERKRERAGYRYHQDHKPVPNSEILEPELPLG